MLTVWAIVMLTAWAIIELTAVAVLTALFAMAVTILTAWTLRTLLITFWFWQQHAVREFELTRLIINVEQLHFYLVTFVNLQSPDASSRSRRCAASHPC